MSEYNIRHYQEGDEIEQARIGLTMAKEWVYPTAQSADQLRELYSRDGFDPESRLYCFTKDGEMVGFITSRILEGEDTLRAELDFPIVQTGHEEVVDLLFNRAVEVLREKNVHTVESGFGLRGGSDKWAEKWGYKRIDELGVCYNLDLGSVGFKAVTANILPFNSETDLDDCVNIFVSNYELPGEAVKNFTMSILENEQTIAYYVQREDGEIVATGAIMKNRIVPTLAMLSAMYDKGLNYLEQLLTKLVERAREEGIERVLMFFTHLRPDDLLIQKYARLGFTPVGSNTIYEKKVNQSEV
ncbi:MAG: hypothetical protein ACFFD9_10110 [Candidatus Thorarchaeota archaeon]